MLASIGSELRLAGHSVRWILRANSRVSERITGMHQPILYRFSKRGRSWHDIGRVHQLIRDWSPDVLIMNDTHAVVLAGLATLCMRGHRPLRLAYKHTVFPLRSRFKYRLLTDKIICVSKAAKQVVLDGGMRERDVLVVYGGIDQVDAVPFCSRSAEQLNLDRQRLGLPIPNRPLLLAVGSLLACKGHADLVQALALTPSDQRPFLAIAGEGEERTNLTRQIGQLGLESYVHLLGYRSDVRDLMRAADVIVHPSTAEGLSLVLIEAQMMQKPIVATSVGGASEVLGQEAGLRESAVLWIAKAGDPKHLASRIQSALASLAEESKAELCSQLEQSAERAQEIFSIQRNANRLVEVASSLLAAPAA